MRNLTDFILEKIAPSPEESKEMAGDKTSDNSLYYRIGRFKFEWNPNKDKQQRILKKYKKDGYDLRKTLISWQKDVAFPLLPEELEVIPRSEWELDILEGVSEDALYHKHYDVWWDHIYKTHKPRHKVLTVFECSNQKPYFYAGPQKYYGLRWCDFSDFASLDYGIQQWEFVNMYPSRWDEWNHYAEDHRMQYLYTEKTKERILEYHKRFPEYEKIIFICQNNHPQRPVNELWEDNTNHFRDWAIILTDDKFRDGIHRALPHMGNGILIQRTISTNYCHKKYAEALASCYSDEKTKQQIKERVKWDVHKCEQEGVYNVYGLEPAVEAYKQKVSLFDPKFMKEYKEKFSKKEE
jgi:hypothetical protein